MRVFRLTISIVLSMALMAAPGLYVAYADPATPAQQTTAEETASAPATDAAESSEAAASEAQSQTDGSEKSSQDTSEAVKDEPASTKTEEKKDSDKKDEKSDAEKKKKEKAAKEKAKKEKIAKVVAYLASLTMQLETASEDLADITKKREKAEKKAKAAKKRIDAAKKDLKGAQNALNTLVEEMYKNGDMSYVSVLLGSLDFSDFVSRLYLLETVAKDREGAINTVERLRKELDKQSVHYQEKLEQVRQLEQSAQQRNDTISSSITAQLELLAKLDPKMLAAVNSYDSIKASRKWIAKYAGTTSKEGSHPEIVGIAANYLGVPYVWGGETPSGFDCSGLVMYCYAKIGISLPHFARYQYDCGVKVASSALMPGDLVFFGPNVAGIHHVGIYVGEGKYIQAPRTGDVVKVSDLSARSDYVGACRPGA